VKQKAWKALNGGDVVRAMSSSMFLSTFGFQGVRLKAFATKDLNFAGVSHFWVFFSFPILANSIPSSREYKPKQFQ
jgi:hypothetical protein